MALFPSTAPPGTRYLLQQGKDTYSCTQAEMATLLPQLTGDWDIFIFLPEEFDTPEAKAAAFDELRRYVESFR